MKGVKLTVAHTWLTLLILFSAMTGEAQNLPGSNFRNRIMKVNLPSQSLDSLSIIPGTFQILVPDSFYSINYAKSEIYWMKPPPQAEYPVSYRVFPVNLARAQQLYNYDSIRDYFLAQKPVQLQSNAGRIAEVFNFGKVVATGSLGRAIGFGNAQDAVVNSELNLQLRGLIGDSMELTAAVSDNNIPFQPEGNTQNISDFDRVFLQVKKKGWQVSLGDIDIRQSRNYFLNFYKRLQGINFITENKLNSKATNAFMVTGAIAKGKFTRNILTPIDGNQGPYKLQGAQNEFYFVILANTERVYIDGVLMQRGETNDYVINYNTAEITFTARRLITKDLRIQAEFEYADRNFLNSQFLISDDFLHNNKFRFYGAAFLNTDAKNSAIDQTLNAEQRNFLGLIGDSVQHAFMQNAVRDSFSAGRILYEKKDTVVNSRGYSIFVYSSDQGAELYAPGFTLLGPGKGNYIQVKGTAIGRLFHWVSPAENGQPQGEWEPVSFLVTPKKHQVFTLGTDYMFGKNSLIKSELALSNADINLFSKKDQGNDKGFASRILINYNDLKIGQKKDSNFLMVKASWEFTDRQFKPVERLRNIEFYRDWGLGYLVGEADENLISTGLSFVHKNKISLDYQPTLYTRSDDYKGLRHQISGGYKNNNWTLSGNLSATKYDGKNFSGSFLRPSYELKKQLKKIGNYETGIRYLGEFNRQSVVKDSLSALSFGFNVYELFLRSDEQKANKWQLSYYFRNDLRPFGKKLTDADNSQNIKLALDLLGNERRQFRMSTTYRQLKVDNSFISRQKEENTLLGRLDFNFNEWDGLLNGTIFYELGSGQEPKREFTYLEVQTGLGNYTWNDYNKNGIQELNEFEEAIYADQKKYIRLFVPGSDYVKADYLQFNYAIAVDPSKVLKTKGKTFFVELLRRSQLNTALQSGKKIINTNSILFNPFEGKIADSTLIQNQSFFSNTLFFNRISSKWGLEFTHSTSKSKSLLSYGPEERGIRNLHTKWRWSPARSLTLNILLKNVNNSLASKNIGFENRNYHILQNNIEPSITYTYKSNLRVGLTYNFSDRKNTITGGEKAIYNGVTGEFKYNMLNGMSFLSRLIYTDINYKGASSSVNSTTGFILLDGLMPGKNFLWNTELIKRIGNHLEVSFLYDGRRAADSRTVHTGRASLKAIF